MNQILLTPSGSKRLIAKAILKNPFLHHALNDGIVAIIAGTTNAYIVEEIFKLLSPNEYLKEFNKHTFFRGISTLNYQNIQNKGFQGDVIIKKGIWLKGKTIYDIIDELTENDIIIKGANALSIDRKMAGIFIGHEKGGTIVTSLQAIMGRKTKLIIPVSLEKRITEDIWKISYLLNNSQNDGLRFLVITGEIITEIEALKILYDLDATLIGGGGVNGAEGGVWLHLNKKISSLPFDQQNELHLVINEPPFILE